MKILPLMGGAEYAHQEFSFLFGTREILFRLDWMPYIDNPAWNLNISEDGAEIINGLLLRGGCDLLSPYQLGLGRLILTGDEPTLDNLGINNALVWVAPNEEI